MKTYWPTGSSWEDWQSRWCDLCTRDLNQDCPIVAAVFTRDHDTIPELTDDGATVRCSSFVAIGGRE